MGTPLRTPALFDASGVAGALFNLATPGTGELYAKDFVCPEGVKFATLAICMGGTSAIPTIVVKDAAGANPQDMALTAAVVGVGIHTLIRFVMSSGQRYNFKLSANQALRYAAIGIE